MLACWPAQISAQQEQIAQPAAQSVSKLALVFSATESDPWVNELLGIIAGEAGFEPFTQPASEEHFDTYGPYHCKLGEVELEVSVLMTGLTAVPDLTGQQSLGQQAIEWLARQEYDLVWLDGDPAQFQIGRQMEADTPILFSGVVLARELYYDEQRKVTGVYRRHSISKVLQDVWAEAPEAKRLALVSDDSPVSVSRVQDLRLLEQALPAGISWHYTPPVKSWDELRAVLQECNTASDAVIVCGMGEWGCAEGLAEEPCPADVLGGTAKPVVVLGPSRMDHAGVTSYRIKPAVHARLALKLAMQLLAGTDAISLPAVTPEEMAVFRSELTPVSGAEAATAAGGTPARPTD